METFRLSATVLDAPDARNLAYFYRDLLGWKVTFEEPGWVMLASEEGGVGLSFATNELYQRPVWPAHNGSQQMMMHLDIEVGDLESATAKAEGLGGVLSDFQPQDDVRVFMDPAGHPFCLFLAGA